MTANERDPAVKALQKRVDELLVTNRERDAEMLEIKLRFNELLTYMKYSLPEWLTTLPERFSIPASCTLESFRSVVKSTPRPQWCRQGQFLMNKLFEHNLDLYHAVSGTSADCFYVDERIPAFWEYLEKHWSST